MSLAPPSDAALARFLSGTVKISRRVEIYEADRTTLWMPSPSIGLVDGTISVDAARNERRTLDLTIVPLDPTIQIGVRSLWYDKIIRPWWGFWFGPTDDEDNLYEVPLGDFMIDSQVNDNFPSSIKITGRDQTKKLLTSTFTRPTTFNAGTALDVLVIAEAGNAGIVDVILPWEAGTAPGLPLAYTAEADSSRYDLLEKILTSMGYEIFLNANGYLVVRPFQDPTTLGPVFTFSADPTSGTLAHVQRRTDDSELYNHVVVRGSSDNNATAYAEVEVVDDLSPVHKDQIGDRVYSYPSSVVTDSGAALTLAQQFLSVKALESYEINMDAIVIPWLEAGEVVGYIDPDPAFAGPTNYFLSNFTIPMKLGTQSAVAKRVVIVQ